MWGRYIGYLGLFWAYIWGLGSLCIRATDGFSINRIHSSLPYNPHWETPPLSILQKQQLEEVLAQPFFYLGCGGQCFAFVSQDQQFVLKFFKHRLRTPYSALYSLPGFEKKKEKILLKSVRDFSSYKLAYEHLRQETGLMHIQLNKGGPICATVQLLDKLNIKHTVDLSQVEFILQKKAQLAHTYIDCLMQSDNIGGAQQAISAIVHLLQQRCLKGIFDEDPRIHRNLGFIGAQPIFIDVGRFKEDNTRKEPEVYHRDIQAITKRFQTWLQQTHPSLVPVLIGLVDENT